MKKEGRDCCPLCWAEVPDAEKPDTSVPNRLRLSGNHRISIAPEDFEHRMHAIADNDLWDALDPSLPSLAPVAAARGRGDMDAAARAWKRHCASRTAAVRLSTLTGMPGRPFLSPEEYRAALGSREDLRADVLRQAEDVVRHELGCGGRVHRFGDTVDFNHDFGTPGMKYGWHWWLWSVPLVSAYAIDGDARYAGAFAELFRQWYAQRDGVHDGLADLDADVIWYELGIAVRTPVFIDALLLAGAEAWPAQTAADLLRTILGHCRWLSECSSRNPFHAYNWPIQSAVTLGYAGTVLPELKEARQWRTRADAVIAEHLRRDFQDDGGYQERTPDYTTYVLELFATYARLLETYPAVEPETATSARGIVGAIRVAVERCLAVWAQLATPLGMAPAVNDTRRGTEMPRLLAAGAREFGRPDFLGPAGLAEFPRRLFLLLPSTGFAVMRSDWTPRARYLFLNLAPWAVHSHEDILSFECFADGAAIAVDPGLAEAGYGDDDYAGWYRAARAHNMVCVEEADPARHLARGEDVRWVDGPRLDFVAATHHGYLERFGVRHRRHVVFLRPFGWIFRDLVWSERPGLRVDWFFHSPLALSPTEDGWRSTAGPGCTLAAADSRRYERRDGRGPADLEGLPGEPSHRDIGWVSYRWRTSGGSEPEEIAVLLAAGVRPAVLRRLAPRRGSPGTARFLATVADRQFTVRIDPDGAEIEGP